MTPNQLLNVRIKCNFCGKEIHVVPYDDGISIIPCDCKNVAKYYTNGLRVEEEQLSEVEIKAKEDEYNFSNC